MQQTKSKPKRKIGSTKDVVNVRRASERVHMQHTFFGMVLALRYLGEPQQLAIQCFQNFYPDQLSDDRLRYIACEFTADYLKNR